MPFIAKLRSKFIQRHKAVNSELGLSGLEYLLVAAILMSSFYLGARVLMAILNWLYAYWITVVVSPVM